MALSDVELKAHLFVEFFVFLAASCFLGVYAALIITAAHFVPSIDYLMLKFSVGRRFHKKLFHNIFAAAGVFLALSLLASPFIAVLGLVNILFHFILDLPGKGIAVVYPLSEFRLRL
jgi:hypothetical protein